MPIGSAAQSVSTTRDGFNLANAVLLLLIVGVEKKKFGSKRRRRRRRNGGGGREGGTTTMQFSSFVRRHQTLSASAALPCKPFDRRRFLCRQEKMDFLKIYLLPL